MGRSPILFVVVVLLTILIHAQILEAASLTLVWDHSPDTRVAGYVVSYGTQPGVYTTTVKVARVTTVTIGNLVEEARYYFAVQSYDSTGEVGAPSAEVSGVAPKLPGAAPLTISCPAPVLTSPDGKPLSVTLMPTVSGGVQPITTTCTPRSGSSFPVGTTSFSCTASDVLLRQASCTSSVTILSSSSTTPTAPTPAAPAPSSVTSLINGSFEDDFAGWTASGNVRAYLAKDNFTATDGDKVAVFNAGNQPRSGLISQSFATESGKSYTLAFDVGAFSVVNRDSMSLEVTIEGRALRTTRIVTVTASGTGSRYVTESVSFTADSAATTVRFRDTSATTDNVDLMLDNVRVATGGTAPAPTAPAPTAGPAFINGSFEDDFQGWTASGNVRALKANNGLGFAATDGERVAVFNSGQQASTGVISQRFATSPGKSYTVTFDVGAYSRTSRDTMRVELTVAGLALRTTRTVAVAATGSGSRYVTDSLSFIADSSETTLTFRDTSPTTDNVDVMLDNVRVAAGATVLAPTAPAPVAGAAFTNGSFEDDFTGWTASGNVRALRSNDGLSFTATDGEKLAVFNSGQQAPTGAVSQAFATTPGKSYTVTFDVGAYSTVNGSTMRLDLTVEGTALRMNRSVTVAATGSGSRYVTDTLTFVADGTATTLTFRDTSSTTDDVDLMLDNVRVAVR